jgi:hypothetical protein
MVQLAYARQALAEWRDRYIVAAGVMVNSNATKALSALEHELGDVSGMDSLLNPGGLARERIDSLMRTELKPELVRYLTDAGEELAAIDARLAALSSVMSTLSITLPPVDTADAKFEEDEPAPVEIAEPAEAGSVAPDRSAPERWLSDVGGRLQRSAATLSQSAGTAADTILNERLGLIKRVRGAASAHIAKAWMNDNDEPSSVLYQLITMIDETAQQARIQLT